MCVGCTKERIFLTYDVFVREDSSLTHPLPCWMKVTDWTVVDVSFFSFCLYTELSSISICSQINSKYV